MKDRIIKYLQTSKGQDVKRSAVLDLAVRAGYSKNKFYNTLKEIADTTANIGQFTNQTT